jgi:hypothetical protein
MVHTVHTRSCRFLMCIQQSSTNPTVTRVSEHLEVLFWHCKVLCVWGWKQNAENMWISMCLDSIKQRAIVPWWNLKLYRNYLIRNTSARQPLSPIFVHPQPGPQFCHLDHGDSKLYGKSETSLVPHNCQWYLGQSSKICCKAIEAILSQWNFHFMYGK